MDKSDKPVKMLNFLKMNNWKIDKFLNTILIIQIVLLSFIVLDLMGIHIPLLRELVSVVYLLFIPGILILRVLRLHELNSIETLLYSVGLSIASVMGIGFAMNLIYPVFGISDPISLFYLIVTMSIFVLIFCLLSYIRDKNFCNEEYVDINILSPKFLFLFIIPFLAIFGTYMVNFYQNNVLLILMILIISILVILVAFDKFSKKYYPFIIFVISISLLFHTSLISSYIWGWDINHEYFLAKLVFTNSYWNLNISYNTNAMLSIVMLAPILSKITNIDLIWIFKTVYPFVFALVPLGLYLVFERQTSPKIAFLSSFFFMAVFTFYRELTQLARQEIAEIFLVLVILLMVDGSMDKLKKALLTVIFAISIIVSHYGLSYIFMLSLICVYAVIIIDEKLIKHGYRAKEYILKDRTNSSFVLLFIIFAAGWYMYTSSSSAFSSVVHIGDHIIGSISTDFLNPDAAQGAAALTADVSSPLHNVPKYLNLLFQFFIGFGVLIMVFTREKMNFKKEYIIFAVINLFILLVGIVVPYFSSALNITRLYHICLFFLAPFAIVGGIEFFKIFKKLFNKSWDQKSVTNSLKLLAVVLVTLNLFFTGVIYEITQDEPTSFALSKIDYPIYDEQEVISVNWLYSVKDSNLVYGDGYRNNILGGYDYLSNIMAIPPNYWISEGSYIYLGKYNLDNNLILVNSVNKASKKIIYINLDPLIQNKSKIYDNNNSQIYYKA